MFGIRSPLFWYLISVLLIQGDSTSVSSLIHATVDKIKDVLNLSGEPSEIAEPPLYLTKNENVVYDTSMIKIPDDEKFHEAQSGDGRKIQSFAQERYHFYNIEDIKSTMIEFFENFASILFSRGENNLSKELKDYLVTAKGITKEDMAKTFQKKMEEDGYYHNLNPQEASSAAYKTTGVPLTFYSVPEIETNKKYRLLINRFNYVLWITYTIYEQKIYPYQNTVQREIQFRQLRGFIEGNSFMKLIIIWNSSNSHKIIWSIFEGSNLPELQITVDNFVNRIVDLTPKLPTFSTHYVTVQGNDMKLRKLMKDAKARFDSLTFYYQKIEAAEKFLNVVTNVIEQSITFDLALEIFEIFINNPDAFYFVLESGVRQGCCLSPEEAVRKIKEGREVDVEVRGEKIIKIRFVDDICTRICTVVSYVIGNLYPSANESPQLYRKFDIEDMEPVDYNALADDDEDNEDEDEDEDVIDETEKHVLDGKQPFRNFTKLILDKVNRNTEEIKEALVKFLHGLCSVLFVQTGVCNGERDDEKICKEETCHPIIHEMDHIKTYIKSDAGSDKIIPKKQCPKSNGCFPIDKNHYGMYLHKLAEMQGLFVAIIDYMFLSLERKIFVKNIEQSRTPDHIKSEKMEKLLEENTLAKVFISEKYREMLLNYFNPKLKKRFQLMKSIKQKIKEENKNSATVFSISDSDEEDSSNTENDSARDSNDVIAKNNGQSY